MIRHSLAPLLFLSLLLATAVFYLPGLSGPFLFDDEPNLSAMGQNGGLINFENFVEFVFSGKSGPTGRPFALASFALNDQSWPSDPYPFKLTNLLLHLLNGVLIFSLALTLTRLAKLPTYQTSQIALFTTAIWLLHPIQLSPVLLVIQRMTELSTTFTLSGILIYLHGRTRLSENSRTGALIRFIGVGLFGSLAILSKENGALLPLYILVIESCFQYREQSHHFLRPTRLLVIYLPVTALAGYCLVKLPDIANSYQGRPFSLPERLYTQSRILFDYLRQIIIPSVGGSGLFHDNYMVSRSLVSPVTTLLAVLTLTSGFIWALLKRKKHPILAFGILWFLAGHTIESSIFPLELYFEHRNYLPLFGISFTASYLAITQVRKYSRLVKAFLAAYIVLLAGMTWHSANIWGSERLLVTVWAIEKPDSIRAQSYAVNYWGNQGNLEKASDYIEAALRINPNNINLLLKQLQTLCFQGLNTREPALKLKSAALSAEYDAGTSGTLEKIANYLHHDTCDGFDSTDLIDLIDNVLKNTQYTARAREKRNLLVIKGLIYAELRYLNPAMAAFDQAFKLAPSEDIALMQAQWLLSAGLHDDALKYLDKAETVPLPWYRRIFGIEKTYDFNQMRHTIKSDKTELLKNTSPPRTE